MNDKKAVADALNEELEMIEKKIAFKERVWDELQKRYPDKWEEYVNNHLEKDLFGNDLINWLKKKVEETPKKCRT